MARTSYSVISVKDLVSNALDTIVTEALQSFIETMDSEYSQALENAAIAASENAPIIAKNSAKIAELSREVYELSKQKGRTEELNSVKADRQALENENEKLRAEMIADAPSGINAALEVIEKIEQYKAAQETDE